MKRVILFLIAGFLVTGPLAAQVHLFLQEQIVELKDGKSSAWVFPVRHLDEALDDMQSYCKDRSDIRMRKNGENQILAEKVSIANISTHRGDLICQGSATENYYSLALVFKLGYDISLNSQEWAVEMSNLRNYAREFMSYHYEQSYTRRVNAVERELKALEKEKDQNEKKIENLNKKVAGNDKKIAQETDSAKVETLEAETNTLKSDIQQLEDSLPVLETMIVQLKSNVDKLKNESLTFQSTIGSI
jgi:uncharacterized coiled-coil protein SlyX